MFIEDGPPGPSREVAGLQGSMHGSSGGSPSHVVSSACNTFGFRATVSGVSPDVCWRKSFATVLPAMITCPALPYLLVLRPECH